MRKSTGSRGRRGRSKITRNAITFRLTPEDVKKAEGCLKRSGEIRFVFKEIRATKLPHLLDDGKLID